MGQFGNQPDFITKIVKSSYTGSNLINNDTFLDGSIVYVGIAGTTGRVKFIPAGAVGASVVTALSSTGVAGSGGSGYVQGTEYDLLGGSGTGLAAEFNVVNGTVVGVIDITSGTDGGYLNGDLVTVDGGDGKATFRVVASPGKPTFADQGHIIVGVQAGTILPITVDYIAAKGTDDAGQFLCGK
jgi:hypothetical protein